MGGLSGFEVVYWWTDGLVCEDGHRGPYECAAHDRRSAHHFFNRPPVIVFKGDVNRII